MRRVRRTDLEFLLREWMRAYHQGDSRPVGYLVSQCPPVAMTDIALHIERICRETGLGDLFRALCDENMYGAEERTQDGG